MKLALELFRLALTLGPDVVKLIIEIVQDIKKPTKTEPDASHDRKAAERKLFVKAWALKHGIPFPHD